MILFSSLNFRSPAQASGRQKNGMFFLFLSFFSLYKANQLWICEIIRDCLLHSSCYEKNWELSTLPNSIIGSKVIYVSVCLIIIIFFCFGGWSFITCGGGGGTVLQHLWSRHSKANPPKALWGFLTRPPTTKQLRTKMTPTPPLSPQLLKTSSCFSAVICESNPS